jgi:flagellar basal body L-ring protein FlgH
VSVARVRGVTSFVLLLAALGAASAESLWSPDFHGYLSGSRGLVVGQSLLVQIDASSSLSFASSTTDSKNLTIDFSGGGYGNLFSFLPQVRTGGSLNTTGKDSLSLKTQVPVVVTAVNPDGSATVEGSRTVAVQGKNESITINGTVPAGQLGQAGSINFSQLANARLTYTTFLASTTNVLSAADLQQVTTPAPTPAPAAAPAAGAAPAGGAPATATTAAPVPAPQVTLQIPDARKRQLLLLYLNRLIDVLFAQ